MSTIHSVTASYEGGMKFNAEINGHTFSMDVAEADGEIAGLLALEGIVEDQGAPGAQPGRIIARRGGGAGSRGAQRGQ